VADDGAAAEVKPAAADRPAQLRHQPRPGPQRGPASAGRGPRLPLGPAKPDADGAIREARAALAADGTSIDAIVTIAHANYYKRLYDTAEVILDDLYKHRSSSQSNPYLYYVYGLVYDQLGEDQKAFLAYRRATELDTGYASALVNLGVHQLANKQYGDAVETYEKPDRSSSAATTPPTWSALGSAYRGQGRRLRSRLVRARPVAAQGRERVQARPEPRPQLRPGLLQPRPPLPRRRSVPPTAAPRSTR
jgi:tetratricopeptide (TPR) repeat protein